MMVTPETYIIVINQNHFYKLIFEKIWQRNKKGMIVIIAEIWMNEYTLADKRGKWLQAEEWHMRCVRKKFGKLDKSRMSLWLDCSEWEFRKAEEAGEILRIAHAGHHRPPENI